MCLNQYEPAYCSSVHSLTVSEHIVVAQEVLNQDADVMTIGELM